MPRVVYEDHFKKPLGYHCTTFYGVLDKKRYEDRRKILRHPSLRCLNLTTISHSLLAFMSEQRGYEDAVKALNTLQTNAQVLAQIRKERGRLRRDNLVEMRRFVERAGVSAFITVLKNSNNKGIQWSS
ncbi:predicted protein [Nematostella vectensis]|uniref:Uncharacterized protein n=1 Tax=Nematostella vectensis TaxID=45351 RepID=A7RZ44_NEMVE|nr:predicted protein [Nematostella vectensis]|eukprot:XP_001635356.1 predicted protein [Nematostella vectensis]